MFHTPVVYLALALSSPAKNEVASEACYIKGVNNEIRKNDPAIRTTWHLKIYRNGRLDWNGQYINLKELNIYLKSLRELKETRQVLSIEFENDISCKTNNGVSKAVIESKLCKEGRCAIGKWNAKRTFIN